MELTKELMKENHEGLWLWCHEDPMREKCEWPRWEDNGGDIPTITADCFPCEYVEQQGGVNGGSCRCPLDFPGWEEANGSIMKCLGGLFDQWICASGEKRSALAKQIAELPLRKEEQL